MSTENPARETEKHAEALKQQLATVWANASGLIEARETTFYGQPGDYIEFETLPDFALPNLSWSSKGIRLATAARLPSGHTEGVIFVPNDSRNYLIDKLDEYKIVRGVTGRPAHQNRFSSIEHFRSARLESLWVDSRPIPTTSSEIWWECWCWPDRISSFDAKTAAAKVLVGEGRLHFVEREVAFVYANRMTIARIVASTDAVAELRLGHDDASFFTSDEGRADQGRWVESARARIKLGDGRDKVAVCLLDTGINRAHPLLAPVFSSDDLHCVDPRWGTDDHDGHGTEMSGLAIYGDLTTVLSSNNHLQLDYVGESVKLLPPKGFSTTSPQSYGLAMQQALLRPEIRKPHRERVYCMAITQSDVHGPKATSWSAALDVAAFGGDIDARRPRLICVSAGNLPEGLSLPALQNWDKYEIEDPAQAWNGLTVGGYTQKGPITDEDYQHWLCAVEIGSLSPYSRVSASWSRSVSPIKPELVLEAGNMGVEDVAHDLIDGIDSLSLLTTSHQPLNLPLTLSWATSAATALLSKMAAEIIASNPQIWPETVRALLTHSARWTPIMEANLFATNQKSERLKMLRRFGYGVPDVARALRSASNSLALVSQQTIQPFCYEKSKSVRLNEAHFYNLPWPVKTLLELGEHPVRLRVTLSYFVEPNPSADAPLSPARYRSAGLRFDLRRSGETQEQFEKRVNELADYDDNYDDSNIGNISDTGRILGEKAISAGSLHVDEWRCSAADLADRGAISVVPVGGWWKTSNDRSRNNGSMRYAIVITIDGGDIEQDLWLETAISAGVDLSIEERVEVGV